MDTQKQSGHGGRVEVRFEGPVAIVTMCRGENRINPELISDFNKALDEVERNPEAKVLITTGEGKFYGNGIDLDWVFTMDPENLVKVYNPNQLWERILTFPMVTIAALNGHAYAGGGIMALSHDYIVMQSGKGWFCLNEVHIPLRFSPFPLNIARYKLTPAQLRDTAVFGKKFTAEEAKAAGFVHQVASTGRVLEAAMNLAAPILEQPMPYNRQALQDMKKDIYDGILKYKNDFKSYVTSRI